MVPVILLNYNSSSDCKKCISFLQKQEGVDLEIIIVDNASTLEDVKSLKELATLSIISSSVKIGDSSFQVSPLREGLRGTLILSDKNRGYNAGNNIGLRYAADKGYKYAFIANPDMEFPDPLYIKKLLSAFNFPSHYGEGSGVRLEDLEGASDSDVVVASSDIVTPSGIHQNPMLPDGLWQSSFGWVKGFFKKSKNQDKYDFIGDYQNSHYCHKVSGCALMVDLDFIKSLGYFDEFPFLYCEEAILAKQIEKEGKKMKYVAETVAIHRHIKSEKGDPGPRFRQWNRSRQYFIYKYAGYPWYGKLLASLSFNLYTSLLILYSSLKK